MELLDPTKWIPPAKAALMDILATHKVTLRIVDGAVELTFDLRESPK